MSGQVLRRALAALAHPNVRIWVVLALLLLVASTVYPNFVSTRNLSNIVIQAVPLTLIALGMAFVLISGEIDLSVGSQISLVSVMVANWMGPSVELMAPVFAAVLGFGLLVGMINGLMVTWLRIPSFIATLAMLLILQSINLVWTKGGPASDLVAGFTTFPFLRLGGIPVGALVIALAVLLGWFVLSRMAIGRRICLVGSNPRAAHVAGLPVASTRICAFAMSGVMAACAGIYLTAYVGSGQSWVGSGMELSAIAAAVLGGVDLFGGRGTAAGAVGGALLLAAVFNLLIVAGVPAAYNPVVTGLLLIAGIAASLLTNPQSALAAGSVRWRCSAPGQRKGRACR